MKIQDCVEEMVSSAKRDGVTVAGNLPFLRLPGQGTEQAVLLVHGFTASPWEMRPLAEDLAASGFATLGVRLVGHGTTVDDLASRQWEEWFADVVDGYQILAKAYRQVYAVGVSTGALLLLRASLTEQFAGLALLSPYLRLQHKLAPWVRLLRWAVSHHKTKHPLKATPYYYDRRPLSGVHQLNRLVASIGPELAEMKTPALILSGKGDQTIDVDSTWDLFMRLGAVNKDYHQFGPEAPHVLCAEESPVLAETLRRVREFFRSVETKQIR